MADFDEMKRKAKNKLHEITGDEDQKKESGTQRKDPKEQIHERRNKDNSIM